MSKYSRLIKYRLTKSYSRVGRGTIALALSAFFFLNSGVAVAEPPLDPRLSVAATQKEYPTADAALLLDDINFTVNPDRSYVFEEHDAVKVITKDGIADNAVLTKIVDRTEARVEVVFARTVKANGLTLKAPAPEYSPLAPGQKAYGAVERFALKFPQVEVGDTVEFHIRTHYKARRGGHFWATTYVQNPMPIVDSTFTVTVPKNVYYQAKAVGGNRGSGQSRDFKKDGVSYRQQRWRITNEKAFEFSPLAPSALSLLKRIEVTSFRNWSEVAEFLGEEWKAQSHLPEGLALRVAGWLPSSGDTRAKASEVLRQLYSGKKVVGFISDEQKFHSPSDLVNHKLLSNSDAALLSSVALSAAGIPNIPVLSLGVSKSSLDDELPIPKKAEKILLKLPQRGRTALWMDPETSGFVVDSPPAGASDTAALSWDPRWGKRGLADLEVGSALSNREEMAIEGRLESNGRAELTVQFDRYGGNALDSRQAAREIQSDPRRVRDRTINTFFRNMARSYGRRARLLGQFFEPNPEAKDPFSLSFTVAVPGFGKTQGDTLLVPLPRFLSSNLRAAAKSRKRSTPLRFDQPYQQDIRIHLMFPKGSEIDYAPELVQKSSPEMDFLATGRAEGNEVWYVGRLTVRDPWVEKDAVNRAIAVLESAMKSENTIVKVRLPSKPASAKPPSKQEAGKG